MTLRPWPLLLCCMGCTDTPSPKGALDEPAAPPTSLWVPADTPHARNAVLIVLDTTRDDAVQAAHTPQLDALASTGTRVDRSWSGGTWTVPSVVSLLTGRFVRHHGWDLPSARMGKYPPLPDVPRLPEVLQTHGVKTFGLYANPYLSEPLGFDRGFDTWKRASDPHIAQKLGKIVADDWTMTDRHFAYVHLLGPHSPLRPSPQARARWDVDDRWFEGKHGFMIGEAKRNQKDGARPAYKAAYHAAIEDTDTLVGEILAALGPHRDDTLVIVTSDHGELLGEHGQAGHGWWLYEELTHVPFIVDHPFATATTEHLPSVLSNVATADLITRGLGIAAEWPVGVHDAPLLAASRDGREAIAFDGIHKIVWDDRVTGASPIRYDLDQDPAEASPVPATPADVRPLDDFGLQYPAHQLALIDPTAVDEKTRKELEALGYVEP